MKKYYVLAACFLTVFIAYAIRYSYGVLLPEMLPSLDVTKTEAGVVSASFFVAYTIFSPILGLIGDRYNSRVLISVFVVLLGVGGLLMAFSTSVLKASVFFALAGIGAAACWAPVMALARRWTDEKSKGRTLAIIDVGSALGIIAAGSAIPVLVVARDWAAGWICLGAVGLVVAVLDAFFIRHSPAGAPEKQTGPRTSVFSLLRDFRFWLIGLAYLLTGFAILIPFTFLSTYAVQEQAFPYQRAAGLLTVIGVSAIVGKLILGPLSDKIKRIRVMMLCSALIMAGSLGMAYGWGSALPYVFTPIFGMGYGAAWAMYAAVASDYFPGEMTGGIVGLWTMFLGVGSVASPVVAGRVADVTGTLAWSFVTAAAAGALSLLLLVPVWRSPPRAMPAEKPFPVAEE
jgi:OFA family oxalate/formate antiporter-like MFS transporter